MKEYFSRFSRMYFLTGGFMLAIGLILLVSVRDAPISPFGTAVPILILGVLLKKSPIVRLFPDRIEIKPAPLARKRIVSLGEIQRVDLSHPKLIMLHTAAGTVKLPAFALHDFERREIIERLGGAG